MTQPTRAKAGRRSRRSASQLFIAALVVFGIVASMLLLFSENVQWLRVGLVTALWAAIVGAFAMTKYRREAVADKTKAKDLQTVYELQLAREISARREYELGVEARVRSEVQIETSEVAALRAELAHLREHLQVLFDGNLPTERAALRADATRMQELGGRRTYDSYQPAPSGLYVPGRSSQPGVVNGRSVDESPSPAVAESSMAGIATPYDEPVTAETSVLFFDEPIGDDSPTSAPREHESRRGEPRAPGGGRRTPTPPRVPAEPDRAALDASRSAETAAQSYSFGQGNGYAASAPASEPPFESTPVDDPEPQSVESQSDEPQSFESQSFEPAAFDERGVIESAPVEESQAPPESQAPAEPTSASADPPQDASPAQDLPDSRPRRRRRAEAQDDGASGAHSNGRSVAEILAGMQSGDAEPSERRHRRRAD
ncbi:hypothetical protein QMK17_08805 [Rhodococcus sp. G-MC3]|uniref:DUF6779 domain-containing protein n=1 Tax=Rhodococcus sp. G-MC3 TaxID=3046209 RepID=UPI0024B88E29|nr:DUF6779 domain-containing protein [Rhodococcus sp. G-MC3]MDJ0393432.1 hypothetical protein [Rhodococcus sp. G-MC3]